MTFNPEATQKVWEQIKVPKHKRWPKIRKTLTGVGAIGLGVFLEKWFPDLTNWVLIFLVGFGGYCLAGDILRNFGPFTQAVAKDLAAAIKYIKDALKNGK